MTQKINNLKTTFVSFCIFLKFLVVSGYTSDWWRRYLATKHALHTIVATLR